MKDIILIFIGLPSHDDNDYYILVLAFKRINTLFN